MREIVLLALCVAAVSAAPSKVGQRIIGGSVVTINYYPHISALLYSATGTTFAQDCGGTILNQRSVLSAAHCFLDDRNNRSRWRFRVGSAFASSGGVVHVVNQIIFHPQYNRDTQDSDVAILQSTSTIVYINNAVQPARIAGALYDLEDDEIVWAAGWGMTEYNRPSEQLRHVQVWTINQEICRERYDATSITDNMLCSGVLDVGGRDQCQGDSGGPLYHDDVVVGICSWGYNCAEAEYPGVNVRVSRFATWILSNA
ncbi:trypsin, alkaline A-like [Anticarsia gemmatalis]|uniref:trypsin, alkaline A-like n=1 Tax=Anticarsia gemmatalis TaxID=129554 RepID=UPI003F7609AF